MDLEFYNDLYSKYKRDNISHTSLKLQRRPKLSNNVIVRIQHDPLALKANSGNISFLSSNSIKSVDRKGQKSTTDENKELKKCSYFKTQVDQKSRPISSKLLTIQTGLEVDAQMEFSIIDCPIIKINLNNKDSNKDDIITIIEAKEEEDDHSSKKVNNVTSKKQKSNETIVNSCKFPIHSTNKISVLDKSLSLSSKNKTDLNKFFNYNQPIEYHRSNNIVNTIDLKRNISNDLKIPNVNSSKNILKKNKKAGFSCYFCFYHK